MYRNAFITWVTVMALVVAAQAQDGTEPVPVETPIPVGPAEPDPPVASETGARTWSIPKVVIENVSSDADPEAADKDKEKSSVERERLTASARVFLELPTPIKAMLNISVHDSSRQFGAFDLRFVGIQDKFKVSMLNVDSRTIVLAFSPEEMAPNNAKFEYKHENSVLPWTLMYRLVTGEEPQRFELWAEIHNSMTIGWEDTTVLLTEANSDMFYEVSDVDLAPSSIGLFKVTTKHSPSEISETSYYLDEISMLPGHVISDLGKLTEIRRLSSEEQFKTLQKDLPVVSTLGENNLGGPSIEKLDDLFVSFPLSLETGDENDKKKSVRAISTRLAQFQNDLVTIEETIESRIAVKFVDEISGTTLKTKEGYLSRYLIPKDANSTLIYSSSQLFSDSVQVTKLSSNLLRWDRPATASRQLPMLVEVFKIGSSNSSYDLVDPKLMESTKVEVAQVVSSIKIVPLNSTTSAKITILKSFYSELSDLVKLRNQVSEQLKKNRELRDKLATDQRTQDQRQSLAKLNKTISEEEDQLNQLNRDTEERFNRLKGFLDGTLGEPIATPLPLTQANVSDP